VNAELAIVIIVSDFMLYMAWLAWLNRRKR